ncbi:carbohydrate esterase family 9 protein [Panus rudis PR-1116 ss-1]|nr:carbohydrate esterase family 9 protein [Panus rudis PR-1116 ss-1]
MSTKPEGLPFAYTGSLDRRPDEEPLNRRSRRHKLFRVFAFVAIAYAATQCFTLWSGRHELEDVPMNAAQILDRCRALSLKPSVPDNFHEREVSDRFERGTNATLIRNATIWTGRVNGLEVFNGDVLLNKGIIQAVGEIHTSLLAELDGLVTIDANGSWLSPGIVDMHSHLGVNSVPSLKGSADGNSHYGPVLPWLRALDGLNTHDEAYKLSVSGGVTTALVLPGSANAIGGQGILIKLRPTPERTPTGMLLENPYSTNITEYDPSQGLRWRQMKHACGENPDRVYSGTRMDTTWAFRQGYNKAREIKNAQDAFCAKAEAGKWSGLGEFPEDYQWEALVDVLRGRVKVHNHCYETVDLDDMVRITNEFKFSIAAFHHAHETYLVPGTLKSAYGGPPAAALFATNARYKRESYRGSEFAPKILAENDIQVVMKSDHPVLDSRYLMYEAQQAHYFGLPHNLALASVTTTPAGIIGQDHRVGYIKKGYDADVVLWDSHPLALGATPKQVWIDGIAQLKSPHNVKKPSSFQDVPKTPDFEEEAQKVLEHDGLPPLTPKHSESSVVVFNNVSNVYVKKAGQIRQIAELQSAKDTTVVVEGGKVTCIGTQTSCVPEILPEDTKVVDLMGGSISPGLISFGSPLGLEEIRMEDSTSDGFVFDPILGDVPGVVGGEGAIIRASDGLQFSTRDALLAYRAGVTTAVTAPKTSAFLSGLGVAFSTGAEHKLKKGAVVKDIVAVHVGIHHLGVPSVSTQITALRNLLLGRATGELGNWFEKVVNGTVPLVVNVANADAIASVIELKKEVEAIAKHSIQVTVTGALESHLVAKELGAANIGVILYPVRPFPNPWENKRALPGLSLTETNTVSALLAHNVTVAIGVKDAWGARNARFDVGWLALDSQLSKSEALALASTNLEKLLGLEDTDLGDLVATQGGDLTEFSSKVIAVISPSRGLVDII